MTLFQAHKLDWTKGIRSSVFKVARGLPTASFSLRTRLLGLVLLAVIPAFGLVLYGAGEERERAAAAAGQEVLNITRTVITDQRRLITRTRQILSQLAQLPEIEFPDPTVCSTFLAGLLTKHPEYANLGVATLDGTLICSAVPVQLPINLSDRPYFRRTMETQDFSVGEYEVGRATKEATLKFGYPVLDDQGKFRGVVFAALDLSRLSHLVAQSQLPSGSVLTVVDQNGTILAHSLEAEKWVGKTLPHITLVKAALTKEREGTLDAPGVDGIHRLYAIRPLRISGEDHAYVAVGIPKALAYAEADRVMVRNLLLLSLATVLALMAAWYGGGLFILRPIHALLSATNQLRSGDLSSRAGHSYARDELGQLARSFNEMAETNERRYKQLQALREIDLGILSTMNLQGVLGILLEKIDLHLPYAAASIQLFNAVSGRLEMVASRNIPDVVAEVKSAGVSRSLPDLAFGYRAPLAIADLKRGIETTDREALIRRGLVSYLGIPLVVKAEVLGVLSFYTREEHHFNNEELEFLTMLAEQASIAIHNSNIYEEMKKQAALLEKANRDLRRREETQRLLKELSQDITTMPLESLLQKLTDVARDFLKVDICDIRLRQGTETRILAASGMEVNKLQSVRRRAGVWWKEYEKIRGPIVISDIRGTARVAEGGTGHALGIRGYLGVPLFSKDGDLLAIMRALTCVPRDFSERETDLLQQLANGAAIAIENAQLYRDLEKSNKVKSEFLGVMSHELRTPLVAILGYAALMEDEVVGKNSLEQTKAIRVIRKSTDDLLVMVRAILDATRIEAGSVVVEKEDVDVKILLDDLREAYNAPLDKPVTLSWDYNSVLPMLNTDRGKLKQMLQNLINNAIKFTAQGTVSILAKHLSKEKGVEFRVADTGIGITEEMLPLVFEKFRQGDSSDTRLYEGVGLELYIVKEFTELLGGRIEVESEPGSGSVFGLMIPCETASQMKKVSE